ncbi:MAG TPA: response regulator [Usitatibacter sp.]|jgi:PAS domain S-box-containing protein|nr:response regulator [Usitatibacter sp.]
MATDDFRRIFESLRVAVVIADAKGTIAYSNSSFGQLASHDAREMTGIDLASLFAAEDRKRLQQNVARVGEGKAGSAFFDAMLTPRERTPHWVSVALQPALDAKDKAAGVIAILQDIGTQRETDEALNLVTARLMAATENSPVAMMIETVPGDVELANDAFVRLLGLDSAAQSLSGLPVKEVLARAPAAGKLLERHPLEVEGGPAGAVWVARASTSASPSPEKGPAEIALIEKIGEELSVALEGMSAISIRAQQMEFDPAIVAHFQSIRTSTETAMAAIGDLVDFSKLSGGVVLHKSRFRLRPALAELISRVTSTAEEKGCRLRIKVEQDVADVLEGDVERLQLILKNLLDNAFALLPGAEIALQIMPEYLTATGIQLSFSVVAAGPAAHGSSSKAADAGMGVAVAKFMVAAMGGKLAIAARAGPETLYAFTIEFPVHPTPPAPPRPTHASLVTLPVLVVSGDANQRLQLSNLLRGWRMVPLEADNAPMAMALLERMESEGTPIPLVMLSNRLPVQDGFLLAFRIKHHPKFGSTLVMMLATDGKPGDAIACRENGISAYMRYPIGDRQLNEAIMAVTGASADADETPTLVTRHSLREQRKGATILLLDPSRDSQILAAHILGRRDCSIVVAQDLSDAVAALDQDVYDLVLVDTSLAGLDQPDSAKTLRQRLGRNAEATRLVATSLEHSPRFREEKLAHGFDGTVAKPFRKDDLIALLATLHRETANM